MSLVDVQMDAIRQEFPSATAEARADGTHVVTVPAVSLPAGVWSKLITAVQFLVPVGFPAAQPDCFWADEDLRLMSGAIPQASQIQTPPFGGGSRLWFSWHLTTWNPSRDSLKTYLRVILQRFQRSA